MDDPIVKSKERATSALEMFLRNLGHVPNEKLNWSPAPTAKSAFQIAAHCAGYAGGFARVIREGNFPESGEAFLGPINAAIESVQTIEQANEMLRAGIAETLDALDAVKPEWIDTVLETPIGPTSFRFFMNIPATHLFIHTGQIDYLQTCWDDQEIYF